jgi:uncharacterized protein (TIGR02145 family)
MGIWYSNQIEFSTLNKVVSLLETVNIGTQIWTSRNLDVSTYRNGETIRHASTQQEWQDAASKGEGAWGYYENDPKNGEMYGKLYNWYAVNDKRGLAPELYHIPSDAEWSVLIEILGGKKLANFKMKSTTGWSNGANGDNSSGFNGLPGGYCGGSNGYFYDIADYGYFWSSSENYTGTAWSRSLVNNNSYSAEVGRFSRYKYDGFSVRCLRD